MSLFSGLRHAVRALAPGSAGKQGSAWVEPYNDVTRAVLYGEQLPGSVVLPAEPALPAPAATQAPVPSYELPVSYEPALPSAPVAARESAPGAAGLTPAEPGTGDKANAA